MDKSLLVQIFVATHAGPDRGHIATGYPVAPRLILTARHTLFPADRDEARPILARWYNQPQDAPARVFRPCTKVAWDGGDECDAALVECEFPDGIRADPVLNDAMPVDHQLWASEGFPRVGQLDETTRPPTPLKGDLYSMADTALEFQLGVDHATALPDGWQGASGSPVFVAGSILGVIVKRLADFGNQRFAAVPTWRLCQHESFRALIGFEPCGARLACYRTKLIERLTASSGPLQSLINKLGLPQPAGMTDDSRAAAVFESLTKVCLETALNTLDLLHRDFCRAGDRQTAALVKDVAYHLLPAVFGETLVEGVRTAQSRLEAALVSLPIGTRTVAEIVMAGFDRRELQLREPRAQLAPDGRLRLPTLPEVGIDPDGTALQNAFHAQLSQILMAGKVKDLHDAFHAYTRRFVFQDQQQDLSPKGLIQAAARRLKHLSERGQTYYCLFKLPADLQSESRRRFEEALRDLKGQYPAMIFLNLSADEDLILREGDLVNPLADLHRRADAPQDRP
jgi:hypothetical protein